MKAKSIHGSSPEEIKSALEKSMADGYSPSVAIIFISVKQDRIAVTEIFSEKGIEIMGATSCGEFINNYQSEGEIAILLMELTKENFEILFQAIGENGLEYAMNQIGQKSLERFANPSLLLCSTGINEKSEFFDGYSMVQELEKALGPDKLFFGGMAGDDWSMKGSYVFTQNNETDNGIVALVLNGDRINLNGMAITGWKPMGIARTVTKSKGNLLYEMDGNSAVDMYLKYLGKEDKIKDKEFNVFEELSFEYPFIVERDTNETVLKSPMKIDHEEYALQMDIEMPEGSKFWFTQPPEFDIVEEILEKAEKVKKSSERNADALLIFSCAGRPPILGPFVTDENNGLAELWQSPMAGFFTYGEYGRALNGKQNLHSGACCWVTISEKK
ncbi:MAG: FIST N-terminal domain-containing protein [Flavobacteriaceae bacterium]|nr:FIST N-terminal domain-containing protein [Flavobacteriaceae bacterium]